MISLDTVPIPNSNIIGRVVDNEAVLVLPDRGKIKVLNEVGAAIWALIDGKRTIQEISIEICEQFEVEQSTAEMDSVKFITELLEREIVIIP